jgi:hypothetical protein
LTLTEETELSARRPHSLEGFGKEKGTKAGAEPSLRRLFGFSRQ